MAFKSLTDVGNGTHTFYFGDTYFIQLDAGDDLHIYGDNIDLDANTFLNDNALYLGTGTSDVSIASDTNKALFTQNGDVSSGDVFTFTSTANSELTAATGSQAFFKIDPEIAQDAGGDADYTALLVDVEETTTGSGQHNLLDLQLATASKFRVDSDGDVTVASSLTVTNGATIDTDGIDLVTGAAYEINGTDVLSSTVLGSTVVTSSLTTVGALNSGSITSGFGSIDVGSSSIDGGIITADTSLTVATNLELTHDATDSVFTSTVGSIVTEHVAPVSLADDAYFDLPDASAGFGTLMVGDGEEIADVRWDTDGTVLLRHVEGNVVNEDLDSNFCIFDNGTAVRVRNRLGSAKTVMFDYHFTTSP